MRRLPLLFCVILLGLSANVLAQQTIVAASRSIDWTHAGAGTLPARLTQCGSTIGAYTGTAATINTAANDPACAGKFIHLGPGEFHLSTGIRLTTNNITLRGDGPDQTKIFLSGPDTSCLQPADVCIEGSSNGSWEGGPQHLTTWNEQFP